MTKTMTNKEHLAMVWEKRYTVAPISPNFVPISGMEGPYQYASGRVLHFDPREQKYYDRTQDLYLSDREAEIVIMNKKTSFRSNVGGNIGG